MSHSWIVGKLLQIILSILLFLQLLVNGLQKLLKRNEMIGLLNMRKGDHRQFSQGSSTQSLTRFGQTPEIVLAFFRLILRTLNEILLDQFVKTGAIDVKDRFDRRRSDEEQKVRSIDHRLIHHLNQIGSGENENIRK